MSTQNAQAPAYVTFVAALKARLESQGIPLVTAEGTQTGLPENAGWVRLESPVNGHKLYVPKSVTRMGLCETTLPVLNRNGSKHMPKVNGKIVCRVIPEIDVIEGFLSEFYGSTEERLPANRLPERK